MRKQISVTLNPKLVKELDEWCADLPRSKAIDLAIKEFLERHRCKQ